MSRNSDDVTQLFDRLDKSIAQYKKATQEYIAVPPITSVVHKNDKLPDLTDYFEQSRARQLKGYPSYREVLTPNDNSDKPKANLENDDPNSGQYSQANHPRK